MRFITLLLLLINFLNAYDLGKGLELTKYLKVGGYTSFEYEKSKYENEIEIEDIALILYSEYLNFSYLVEFESSDFAKYNFMKHESELNEEFHIERAYIDYQFSQKFKVRVGKFITPIGYWNLTPVNVLRDSLLNPIYSDRIFPKYVTGAKVYGYLGNYEYSLFNQNKNAIDKEYLNISVDKYYGLSIKREFENFGFDISIGEFRELSESESHYLSLSLKYQTKKWQHLFEYAIAEDEWVEERAIKYAFYLQSRYRVDRKNYITLRYEHFDNREFNEKDDIVFLGYNHRIKYPISLKFELVNELNSNESRFTTSLSVLF